MSSIIIFTSFSLQDSSEDMLTLLSPIENFLKRMESSTTILFDQGKKKKKRLSQGTLAHLKGQHGKAIQKWKSGLPIHSSITHEN